MHSGSDNFALYLGNVATHEPGHTFGLQHYDILSNNLPMGDKLQGKDADAFRNARTTIDRLRQTMAGPVLVASGGRVNQPATH